MNLEEQLAALKRAEGGELQARYVEMFGERAPTHQSRPALQADRLAFAIAGERRPIRTRPTPGSRIGQGAQDDIAAEVARQLEKLSLLEREAWGVWEHSKQPAHSTVVHRGGENEPSKMRQTLKHQTGDVRYLDQVQKCLAATRALLGLSPAREPLAGDAPHSPPTLDTTDAHRITLAEALPIPPQRPVLSLRLPPTTSLPT